MIDFPKWFRLWTKDSAASAADISPLPVPPPFRRFLAINSDVEWTTWNAQIELIKAFARKDLEVSFGFWFFGDPTATWRLFENDCSLSVHAKAGFNLIRAGVLDSIHSFGGILTGKGSQFCRTHIAAGYKILELEGIKCAIYSNHGSTKDIQNIGGPWTGQPGMPNYQQGDIPGTPSYHLDLTLRHGVRFFWTDIDLASHLRGFSAKHVDEADDGLFDTQVSRDGNPILRFRRTDLNMDPVVTNFAEQISRALESDSGSYCVIYTHLGAGRREDGKPYSFPAPYLAPRELEAIDTLAAAQRSDGTLVTTTKRMLSHAIMMTVKPWTLERFKNVTVVTFFSDFSYRGINFHFDWEDFSGFTLTAHPQEMVVARIKNETRELPRWSVEGRTYAGLPWHPVSFGNALEEVLKLAPI